MPNWHRQLTLALVLFALGSFAYWLEFRHKPEQEERSERDKKVLSLEHSQVRSIRVASERNSITLECVDFANKMCKPGDNSKWQLVEPIQVKADDSNSNSLVSTINNLTASDTISLKEETPEKRAALLKEYGLDPASISHDRQLQVTTGDGTRVIYVGATHPIGEGYFAAAEKLKAGEKPGGKIDDSEIYVLPSYFKASFDRSLSYWRDKKVLSVAAHEVEAFTLKNSKGEIRGERKNGMWTLHAKGDEIAGDVEAMDTLLTGATYLVAKEFASDDKHDKRARAALSGTKQVITLTLKKENEPQPTTLTLHQKPAAKAPAKGVVQNRVFAVVSNLDPVFEVESYSKERLEKSLQDLRLAKLITSMDRFSAKRLEFAGSGYGPKPRVLLNKDSRWEVEGDPKQKINAEKVQTFLDNLTASKIQMFVSQNPPKPTGALEFTLGDDAQAQKRKFLFWREAGQLGQKLYAKDLLSSRKEVFLMDNSLSGEIPWDKAKLE